MCVHITKYQSPQLGVVCDSVQGFQGKVPTTEYKGMVVIVMRGGREEERWEREREEGEVGGSGRREREEGESLERRKVWEQAKRYTDCCVREPNNQTMHPHNMTS